MDARYLSDLKQGTIADALASVMTSMNYSVEVVSSKGRISVIATTRRSPREVILSAEPQKLDWIILPRGNGVEFGFTSRYAPWYAFLLIIAGIWSLVFWGRSMHALFFATQFTALTGLIGLAVFCVSFAVLLLVNRAIAAGGSELKSQMLRNVDAAIHAQGGVLARIDKRSMGRHQVFTVLHAIVAVVIAAWVVLSGSVFSRFDRASLLYFGSLVGLLAPLGYLVFLYRRPGVAERCSLMIPALTGAIGLVILQGAIVILEYVGHLDSEAWRRGVERGVIPVVLIGVALFVIGFIRFIFWSLKNASEAARTDRDIKAREGGFHTRHASDPSSYIVGLRWALLMCGAILIPCMLFPFIRMIWSSPDAGAFSAMMWIIRDGVGAPSAGPIVYVAAITAISLLLLPLFLSWGLSLGEYFFQLHRIRRLARRQDQTHQTVQQLQTRVNELASIVSMRPPHVVVVPGNSCFAAADVVGCGGQFWIIAVGEGVVESLTNAELQALLAHEMAHHLNGDCVRHRIVRLFARLALLGDGYAGILEHSYAYETNADQTAVLRFGISPQSLKTCIRKLDAVSMIDATPHGGGLKLKDRREESSAMVTEAPRISILEKARICWRCYTCGTAMGYWHPTVQDRIIALESLEGNT